MLSERNVLTSFSALVGLVAFASAIYVLATDQFHDVDGIMLILVSLVMAVIFGSVAAYQMRAVWGGFFTAVAAEGSAAPVAMEHGEEAHGGSTGLMLTVWGGLLALTAVEVFLGYNKLPVGIMLVTLMVLSICKAGLIVAYFMHLRFERRTLVLTVVPAVVVAISLLCMFFPDSLRITHLGVQ